MEIKGTWKKGFEHRLIFSGLDLDVMHAIVSERQFVRSEERRGLDDISEIEVAVSGWSKSRHRRIIRANDLSELKLWLREFAERTDEEVELIPDITCNPVFNNELITKRAKLGRHALAMSQVIGQKEQDDISKVDIDSGITDILNKGR